MSGTRIARVEVLPLVLPFRGEFRISRGVIGATDRGRTVALVKVTADDGTVGWGESSPIPVWSPETLHSVVGAIRDHLGPAVIGRPVDDLDGLHRAMHEAIAPGFGAGMPIAKAGIDIAVHDLLGKIRGLPLWALLGYRRATTVTLSWTVGAPDLDSARRSIEEGRQRGYRHFNVKVGHDVHHDVALCEMVRKVAPDSVLWGDANGGIPPHRAAAHARALEAAGLDLLEQPVRADAIGTWRELRQRVEIPIVVDETVTGPGPLMELIRADAVSGVALKVTRTGGIFPSRQCAEIAMAAGLLLVSSGLTDAGVALAANVHLAAAFGVELPCALNGPQFLADDVLAAPLAIEGDLVTVPDGPGLGIVVDEEKVRHYAVSL